MDLLVLRERGGASRERVFQFYVGFVLSASAGTITCINSQNPRPVLPLTGKPVRDMLIFLDTSRSPHVFATTQLHDTLRQQ